MVALPIERTISFSIVKSTWASIAIDSHYCNVVHAANRHCRSVFITAKKLGGIGYDPVPTSPLGTSCLPKHASRKSQAANCPTDTTGYRTTNCNDYKFSEPS
jgi:hypothetical protein